MLERCEELKKSFFHYRRTLSMHINLSDILHRRIEKVMKILNELKSGTKSLPKSSLDSTNVVWHSDAVNNNFPGIWPKPQRRANIITNQAFEFAFFIVEQKNFIKPSELERAEVKLLHTSFMKGTALKHL